MERTKMKIRSIALAVIGFHLFASVGSAHVPEEGYPGGPWMMWWGHGFGWWIFPLVMMVVFLIFCLLFFGRRGGMSRWCGLGGKEEVETPLDILKKRYAKGEIGKEEFEAMKKDM